MVMSATAAQTVWDKAGVSTLSTERDEVATETRSRRSHPHGRRRREILQQHPEVSKLMGTNGLSLAATVGLVSVQLALAVLLRSANAWCLLVFAYGVGAMIDHSLWVLIHDAGHNLFFRNVALNRVSLIVANAPHVFPSAVLFRYYHILHHIELNKPDQDPDVPLRREAEFVGNSALRKAVWLFFFALVQSARMLFYTHRTPGAREMMWVALNWLVVCATTAAVALTAGTRSVVYLVLSSLFAIGLHPLGARWIAEHYPTKPFQSTYSYYGKGNRVAFNIGFHNEHHDFPSVPWNRLPALRKVAPEYYDTLFSYGSYTKLLLDFIFNPEWDLGVRFDSELKRTD